MGDSLRSRSRSRRFIQGSCGLNIADRYGNLLLGFNRFISFDSQAIDHGSCGVFSRFNALGSSGLGSEWSSIHQHLLAQPSPSSLYYRCPSSFAASLVLFSYPPNRRYSLDCFCNGQCRAIRIIDKIKFFYSLI